MIPTYFEVDGTELKAYIGNGEGTRELPCHYCGKQGHSMEVCIDGIFFEKDDSVLASDTPLYRKAKKKLETAYLHGRGICKMDGEVCDRLLIEDQHESARKAGF